MKDTKAEKGMLKEASSINKSLFTLGKVSSPAHQTCCESGRSAMSTLTTERRLWTVAQEHEQAASHVQALVGLCR